MKCLVRLCSRCQLLSCTSFTLQIYKWCSSFTKCKGRTSRSQLLRGLRRRSAAARLLISWVRIPPGAWMFVYCECCVLSGRGLCDELITRPEESYPLWCVVVCDLETSRMRRPWPTLGRSTTGEKKGRTLRCLWVVTWIFVHRVSHKSLTWITTFIYTSYVKKVLK